MSKSLLGTTMLAAVIATVVTLWLTAEHAASLPAGARAGMFTGHWVNEDSATGGITRVWIEQRLDKLFIHTWGACHPRECDHGVVTVNVSDTDHGTLSIKRTQLQVIHEALEIAPLPDGRLRVVVHTHFSDSSGRPDFDGSGYFKRQ